MVTQPLFVHPEAHHRSVVPLSVSILVHAAAVAAIFTGSILVMHELPDAQRFLSVPAFVAPTPPQPPPPPQAAQAAPRPQPAPTVVRTQAPPVPLEAPPTVRPEENLGSPSGVAGGIAGSVSTGVPWGVVGGIPGGVGRTAPKPEAARPSGPVRVGGELAAPELLHQELPEYPAIARQAQLKGRVKVEAIVDVNGGVTEATVVETTSTLFNAAAVKAVRAWRYRPMLLNGTPVSFIVDVTIDFLMPPRR
jgi:protein TonB